MPREFTYPIASRGLATSFTESETPPEYALAFRNRFINAAGGAEMRQGVQQWGDTVAGAPNLTNAHELVKSDGTTVVLVSGEGQIWRKDDDDYTLISYPLTSTDILYSQQMGSKLFFNNGVDRNFYTEDGVTFKEAVARIITGAVANASAAGMEDGNVTNWISDTDVAVNDLVANETKGAYGIITAVASADIAHTPIGSAATGIGVASGNQNTGDIYQIIDLVELNIIPGDVEPDNTATAAADTTVASIAVSAVADWTATDIRVGDYVRNTTRTAVTQVTAVSTAAIGVHGIAGQTGGDSLILLKSAMPISTKTHVHFGHHYHIDSRDRRKILFSGPNDPLDMTNGGTIDSSTFKFGELQSSGDIAMDMASFQRFLAICGRKDTFLFSGTDPLASDGFTPVGLFPQGVTSQNAMLSIGNDVAFVTPDGVQTISLVGDASTLGRANISEALKTTMRDDIAASPNVLTVHYPRRSWFIVKIGSKLSVFNYTAFFGTDQLSQRASGSLSAAQGSWSEFDGKFARQNAYLVLSDGTLICVGTGGKVYRFDQGDYDDDGEVYTTSYKTGHLTMQEPRKSVRRKNGVSIKPIIHVGTNVTYTIRAEAAFDNVQSSDEVVQTIENNAAIGQAEIGEGAIGGTGISNQKYPLRWNGEVCQFTFNTNGGAGPDVLSRFTVYHNWHGKE